MRVLFVYPDLAGDITNYTGVTSYGIAILSALAREAGHEPLLLHVTAEPDPDDFRRRVAAARPDLVAFSTNSHYARRLAAWTAWAAEATGAPVAVGGVHATLAPEDVMALPAVSYVCVGEGEEPFLDLCRALETGDDTTAIPNLWVRTPAGVVRNGPRLPLRDLDALPDPDYGLFDFASLYPVRRGLFPYIMSRGCAFRCTYCSVHALRELTPGGVRFWRFLSPRRAAEQLRDMIARHAPGTTQVQFLDAILFPHRRWLREFAPLYRELVGLPFSCNLRADFVDDEVADILAGMGCEVVRFGVESGDDRLTREVLDRQLEIADIRRAFALLAERGIARWSYNIVGLPDENVRLALSTIRLNAEIEPDLALAFIFYPYPGTVLHDRCLASGELTDKEFDHYFDGVATRIRGFRAGDILFLHRFFQPLIRLYRAGNRWPDPLRRAWYRTWDAALASPLVPRAAIVGVYLRYRTLRHWLGERIVGRSPRLYRLLGGTDPA